MTKVPICAGYTSAGTSCNCKVVHKDALFCAHHYDSDNPGQQRYALFRKKGWFVKGGVS